MRVRILMHATAGRRQDHLRFALQEAIAPVLYPDARDRGGDIRPAVHPAVEALMHQYHAHAKLIRNETERLMQRATARDDQRRKTEPVLMPARAARRPIPNFVRARRRAGAEGRRRVREQAVGDDPDLPGRHRAGRAAGAAHARAARRAAPHHGPSCCARTPRPGRASSSCCSDTARPREPVAAGADAGPGAAGARSCRSGSRHRARAARHLSRVHRRPARAVRGRAAARARRAASTRRAFPIPSETVRR